MVDDQRRPIFRFLCVLIFLSGFSIHGSGQNIQPGWQFNNRVIADNREYENTFQIPQTFFGINTEGYGTLQWDSAGFAALGANYFHEFGSGYNPGLLNPVAFIQVQTGKVTLRGGAMPRQTTQDYPRFLIRDSIKYFRPTIEGLTASIETNLGKQNLWIDWTSRQSGKKREIFVLGASGTIQFPGWFLRHGFILHHLAGRRDPQDNEPLRDNAGLSIMAGRKMKDIPVVDSLSVSTGALVSLDRLRGVYGWQTPAGWQSKVSGFYKWLGTRHTFYAGDSQSQVWGDPFYQGRYYSRHEVLAHYHRGKVSLEFSLAFHRASRAWHNQQVLHISVRLP